MNRNLSDILFNEDEFRPQYYNAVSPPLIQTSNFAFEGTQAMRMALHDEYSHSVYSRGNNPTVAILRHKLAALEDTDDALVFSSGCAAIAAVLFNRLKSGDHMVCIRKPYSWVTHFCENILPRYGIGVSFADEGTPESYAKASTPATRLYYLESPNTFTFEITDIAGVASLASERGIVTAIDNSYCTPLYQQPHQLGVDLVIHSASKYLSGHSDVVAGVVCGRKDMIREIYDSEYLAFGGIIAPFDAWLMLRGLRTLELRLQRSSANAGSLVALLDGHPLVRRIYYPFYPGHPMHVTARKQMKACSGLFSVAFDVEHPEQLVSFCDNLKHFLKAVSWGGFESLVFPALTFYDFDKPPSDQISWKIVRFYAGLEDKEILIKDVEDSLQLLTHE
jgi:cystathionine beta-lyase/cystathionine gamma-synthase